MYFFYKKSFFRRGVYLTILGLFFSLLPALLLIATAQAHTLQAAHAEYVSSDPASNAMLKTAPTTVVVHFSEAVNPSGSNLLVYDVNGKLISPAVAQVDRNDLKTMTVSIQPDGSEIYVVLWHTVSAVEGHHDSGSFRFFVNISPMLQSMVSGKMSGMTGTQGMNSSSSSSSASSSSGMPVWAAILIGIIGLIIGVGISFLFLRSQPTKVQRG